MSEIADRIGCPEYVGFSTEKEAGDVAVFLQATTRQPMPHLMTSSNIGSAAISQSAISSAALTSTAINRATIGRTTRFGLTLAGSLTGALAGLVIGIVTVLIAVAAVAAVASSGLSVDATTDGAVFQRPLVILAGATGVVAGGSVGRDLTRWWLHPS